MLKTVQLKITQLDSLRSTPPTHIPNPNVRSLILMLNFSHDDKCHDFNHCTVAKLDFSSIPSQTNDRRSGLVIFHSSASCAFVKSQTIPITYRTLHSFASDGMEIERNLFDVIFFRMQNTYKIPTHYIT